MDALDNTLSYDAIDTSPTTTTSLNTNTQVSTIQSTMVLDRADMTVTISEIRRQGQRSMWNESHLNRIIRADEAAERAYRSATRHVHNIRNRASNIRNRSASPPRGEPDLYRDPDPLLTNTGTGITRPSGSFEIARRDGDTRRTSDNMRWREWNDVRVFGDSDDEDFDY